VKPYLLDVNLLLALAWPSHQHHRLAQQWFAESRAAGFRTCPLTETAFVRISSNPAFTGDAVSPRAAMDLLEAVRAMPEHGFWPDDLALCEAFREGVELGLHRQITDAYLIALARTHGGVLATLDRDTLAVPGAAEFVAVIAEV
jgi:toxin-antitoxin system PIN domain toxin